MIGSALPPRGSRAGLLAGLRGRDRVLQAALEVFTDRGFDRVTIRDVADHAGLSNPALYKHFQSKEALGLELYRRSYRLMVDTALAAGESATGPLDKLEAYIVAMDRLHQREPLAVSYVDEHQLRFWRRIHTEFEPQTMTTLVRSWVDAARAEGAIQTGVLPEMQVALIMGVSSQWAAMRTAGLAPRSSAASLGKFVRQCLVGRK